MAAQAPVLGAAGGAGDRKLEEALGALMAALDDYRGQFPELQGLEQEVTRLESLLMVRRAGLWQHREGSQAAAAADSLRTPSRDKVLPAAGPPVLASLWSMPWRASASSTRMKTKTVMVLGTGEMGLSEAEEVR